MYKKLGHPARTLQIVAESYHNRSLSPAFRSRSRSQVSSFQLQRFVPIREVQWRPTCRSTKSRELPAKKYSSWVSKSEYLLPTVIRGCVL